jgi:hypothetical protein
MISLLDKIVVKERWRETQHFQMSFRGFIRQRCMHSRYAQPRNLLDSSLKPFIIQRSTRFSREAQIGCAKDFIQVSFLKVFESYPFYVLIRLRYISIWCGPNLELQRTEKVCYVNVFILHFTLRFTNS